MIQIEEFIRTSQERNNNLQEVHEEESSSDDPNEKVQFSFEEFVKNIGEQRIYQVIGFDKDGFMSLFTFLKPNLEQKGRGRRSMGGKEKLFIFLSWVASGFTFSKLALLLKIAKTTIYDSITFIFKRIKSKLVSKFLPINGEEARDHIASRKFDNHPLAIGPVDTSIIRIRTPSDNVKQRKYYSGKHKCHCVKFQTVINPDGICIHYSGIYPGKKHDLKIFESSDISRFISFVRLSRNNNNIIQHPVLLADSGYQGAARIYEEIVVQFKKNWGVDT